jgi:hypothetical protein
MTVEGITSPDGRILGKMAHSERIGKNVYKNIIGEKDQKIFESGVEYLNKRSLMSLESLVTSLSLEKDILKLD